MLIVDMKQYSHNLTISGITDLYQGMVIEFSTIIHPFALIFNGVKRCDISDGVNSQH